MLSKDSVDKNHMIRAEALFRLVSEIFCVKHFLIGICLKKMTNKNKNKKKTTINDFL